MNYEMNMQFAQVAHHPDGRSCIIVEGVLIPLAIEDQQRNNLLVDRIVRGLRRSGENRLTIATSAQIGPASVETEEAA